MEPMTTISRRSSPDISIAIMPATRLFMRQHILQNPLFSNPAYSPASISPLQAMRRNALDNPPCPRSEEHTSELQSLMCISYAVFCLKKKKQIKTKHSENKHDTT